MSWLTRLRPSAYTPPGGARIPFAYGDLSLSQDIRGTVFNFPDADGKTYVQRTGISGRRYPVRAVFHGSDCDLQAESFMSALAVGGVGMLEHPTYGQVDVIPFGEVSRRDDLVSAANQSVVEVEFWDTIVDVYPSTRGAYAGGVKEAVERYNTAAGRAFARLTSFKDSGGVSGFVNSFKGFVAQTKSGLQVVSANVAEVQSQFDRIHASLDTSVDVLIRDPLTLASQTLHLVQTPARSLASLSARISAYANLTKQITSKIFGDSNTFHAASLFASGHVSSVALSSASAQIDTREEALISAASMLSLFDEYVRWRDAGFDSVGEVDDGVGHAELYEAVTTAAAYLITASFGAKQTRRLVIDRVRTPVDVCAQVYGGVDDYLQVFIDQNKLSWREHLTLQPGRSIVYYV